MKKNILAGLASMMAIFILGSLDKISGLHLLIAPFGASCVLLFGIPDSKLVSPRNLLGGHLVASLCGLALYALFPDSLMAMSTAVGLAITLMFIADVAHPAAGANPILIFLSHAKPIFLLTPILGGVMVLMLLHYIYRRFLLPHLT